MTKAHVLLQKEIEQIEDMPILEKLHMFILGAKAQKEIDESKEKQ